MQQSGGLKRTWDAVRSCQARVEIPRAVVDPEEFPPPDDGWGDLEYTNLRAARTRDRWELEDSICVRRATLVLNAVASLLYNHLRSYPLSSQVFQLEISWLSFSSPPRTTWYAQRLPELYSHSHLADHFFDLEGRSSSPMYLHIQRTTRRRYQQFNIQRSK